MTERVEDGDACAENGGVFCGGDVLGHPNRSFDVEKTIFSVLIINVSNSELQPRDK